MGQVKGQYVSYGRPDAWSGTGQTGTSFAATSAMNHPGSPARLARTLLLAQGAYYVATGVWPLLHLASEAGAGIDGEWPLPFALRLLTPGAAPATPHAFNPASA